MAAETLAWFLVYQGRLTEDRSLQKHLNNNIGEINKNRPPFWLIGNSALEFGVVQERLSKELHLPCIKLCHGGATVRGSAAMLDFYLNECSFMPEYVFLFVTKDDFNPNGAGARTSEKYLDLMTWWGKYKKNYSWLRSVRRSLYDKMLTLWSRVFVKKKDLQFWREKYQVIKINADQQEIIRAMMKDYRLDAEALTFYAEICKRHELKKPGVVLLPISEEYANWHDREFPAIPYQMVREKLKEKCLILGLIFVDLGDPIKNRNLFRDPIHLNPQGAEYLTTQLSQKLSGIYP